MKTISIVTMVFLPGTAIAVRTPFSPLPPTFRMCRSQAKAKFKKDHLQHVAILHLFAEIYRFHSVLDLLGRRYSFYSRRAAYMELLDSESGRKIWRTTLNAEEK